MGWLQFGVCVVAAYLLYENGNVLLTYAAVGVAVVNIWSFGIMKNCQSATAEPPTAWTAANMLSFLAGVALLGSSFVLPVGQAVKSTPAANRAPAQRPSERVVEGIMNPAPPYWWQPEYEGLRDYVLNSQRAVTTSYITDKGKKMVIGLRSIENRGLSLYLMPPKGVLGYRDRSSGQIIEPEIVVIWDRDMDTKPDGFWSGQKEEELGALTPFSKEDFQGDGKGTPILILWNTAIGFSVNHLLHDIESSLPRQ